MTRLIFVCICSVRRRTWKTICRTRSAWRRSGASCKVTRRIRAAPRMRRRRATRGRTATATRCPVSGCRAVPRDVNTTLVTSRIFSISRSLACDSLDDDERCQQRLHQRQLHRKLERDVIVAGGNCCRPLSLSMIQYTYFTMLAVVN